MVAGTAARRATMWASYRKRATTHSRLDYGVYVCVCTCVCVCVLERDPEKRLLRNRQCTSALTFENLFFLPDTAISYYTQALERDPQNHFLYSNRSAAYAKLQDFWTAERDAQQVILFYFYFSPLFHMICLAQDRPKGYSCFLVSFFFRRSARPRTGPRAIHVLASRSWVRASMRRRGTRMRMRSSSTPRTPK